MVAEISDFGNRERDSGMKEHREMFQYVRNRLERQAREADGGMGTNKGCTNKDWISYSRYDHVVRVYKWMLRITSELKDDSLDLESLKIATIFHDVGYGLDTEEKPHARISAEICKDYLEARNYPYEKVEFICDLIARHSMKRLLYQRSTELELIVLMEADLLDDTGAMGLVMDTWIEGLDDHATFESMAKHMEKYTYRHMKQVNMVTAPAKKFWHEKRKLVYEFVRQYRRDLGDMK